MVGRLIVHVLKLGQCWLMQGAIDCNLNLSRSKALYAQRSCEGTYQYALEIDRLCYGITLAGVGREGLY